MDVSGSRCDFQTFQDDILYPPRPPLSWRGAPQLAPVNSAMWCSGFWGMKFLRQPKCMSCQCYRCMIYHKLWSLHTFTIIHNLVTKPVANLGDFATQLGVCFFWKSWGSLSGIYQRKMSAEVLKWATKKKWPSGFANFHLTLENRRNPTSPRDKCYLSIFRGPIFPGNKVGSYGGPRPYFPWNYGCFIGIPYFMAYEMIPKT